MAKPGGRPIIVATSGDYPPFSVLDDHLYQGFDIDLVTAIGDRLARPIAFTPFQWPALGELLREGCAADSPFDLIASGLTVTEARRSFGAYTRPYLRNHAVALAPAGTMLEPLDLTTGKAVIGVNRGGYLEALVRRSFALCRVVTTDDNLALATLLDHGAGLIVTDAFEAAVLRRKRPLVLLSTFGFHDLALFVPQSRLALLPLIDEALGALAASGALAFTARAHAIPVGMLPPLTP